MSAKPLYGSNTPITVTLDNLANGAIADSTEFNNTALLGLGFRIGVDAKGSNAAEAGSLIVYARGGLVTGKLATDKNLTRIGSIVLNGDTAVYGEVLYESPAPFFKLSFKQASSGGYALGASGNSAFILSENIQDV